MHHLNPGVAFIRHWEYDSAGLDQAVDRLLAIHFGSRNLRSFRVLLKPNLISPGNNGLPCTEPAVIAAAAQWFVDRGADVVVGDSPAFGTAAAVLGKIGATPLLEKVGAEICEFSDVETVELPSGKRAGIAAAARECDLLVNLPRVKAHGQARVTMAVKNLFGCVVGMQKPWWHMVHGGSGGNFSDLLVQIPSVLPDSIALLDGITTMHGTGPIHGRPFSLGLLGSSRNPFALDTAVLDILDIEPGRCPLWCAARRADIPGTRLDEIEFLFSKDVEKVKGFEVPEELMPIRFNPFRFIKNSLRRVVSSRIG